MSSYKLKKDEVILYEKFVKFGKMNSEVKFTLTSKNMIFEKEKGFFSKKLKVFENIPIDHIKMYKDKVSIKQKKSTIIVQTVKKNIEFTCNNMIEAKKVISKIINIKTDSSFLDRTKKNANKTIDVIKEIGETAGKVADVAEVIVSVTQRKK